MSRTSAIYLLLFLLLLISVSSAARITQASKSQHEYHANGEETLEAVLDSESSQRLIRPRQRLPQMKSRLAAAADDGGEDRTSKAFTGIPFFTQYGHNISRVSFMLYKAIRENNIQSMVDVPCRSHIRWMPQFLTNIKPKDGKRFSYFCVDSNDVILQLAKALLGDVKTISKRFLKRNFWKTQMPQADLVFAWGGLELMKKTNVNSLVQLIAKEKRHKFLIIGSSPLSKNTNRPGMNIRKAPFRYNRPARIYKELSVITTREHPEKHMYLYQVADLKKGK